MLAPLHLKDATMTALRKIQEVVVAAAAIAALLFPATLAAADRARSELVVGATVVPTCVVSTDAHASAVALSCTPGGRPSISTERRVVSSPLPSSQRGTGRENHETDTSTASRAVTFVTISY